MTRIEAINAMLQGKLIRHNNYDRGSYCYKNENDIILFFSSARGIEKISGALDHEDGYEIYEKPRDKIKLIGLICDDGTFTEVKENSRAQDMYKELSSWTQVSEREV